jgi:hypothetical protein
VTGLITTPLPWLKSTWRFTHVCAFGGIQFARREHHALVCRVEPVAVHIHVLEFVVGTDFLQLHVCIHQRLPVPQPYIVDGRLVGLECLEGEVPIGREGFRRNLTEIVSLLGQRNVAFDVGLLQLQLIWFDEHTLEYSWHHAEQHYGTPEDEQGRCREEPVGTHAEVRPRGERRHDREPGQQPQKGQLQWMSV